VGRPEPIGATPDTDFYAVANRPKENEMNTAPVLKRVPHIVFAYWVIKIASTTLGETGADLFSMTLDLGYGITIAIFMSLFVVLLGTKLSMGRYTPLSYWLLFTSTAVAGTGISDFIDRTLGLGYAAGSAILLALLITSLAIWHRVEGSISVERISSARAEVFYWVAFLIANTLGTAAGDFLADDLRIGFLASAGWLAGILLLTALVHFYTKRNGVLLFWVAFVLTRPFGATFGDLLTKSQAQGGLGYGTVVASLFFATLLAVALVREDREERRMAGIATRSRPEPLGS
jgi:uncharacterized membrane-anchored protein